MAGVAKVVGYQRHALDTFVALEDSAQHCLLGMLVPVLAFILGLLTWLALAGIGIYNMVMIIIAAVNAKNVPTAPISSGLAGIRVARLTTNPTTAIVSATSAATSNGTLPTSTQ